LSRIDRVDVGAKQHRQPFYFRFWYRCDNASCATKLVMPVETPAAITWNVEPFPLRKDWRRDRRDRPHHAEPSPSGVTPRREGPPPDPADSSPPW
jgi:hypothetical protein